MIYGLSCRATGLSGFWIVFTSVIAGYVELHVQQALRHRACPIPSYPEPRLCLLISDCLEDFMASQVANHFFSMSGGKSAVSGQVHILVENSRDINTVSTVIINIILIVTINHYYQPLFTITTCLTTFVHNLSYSYNYIDIPYIYHNIM
jgi:hypothetical protein